MKMLCRRTRCTCQLPHNLLLLLIVRLHHLHINLLQIDILDSRSLNSFLIRARFSFISSYPIDATNLNDGNGELSRKGSHRRAYAWRQRPCPWAQITPGNSSTSQGPWGKGHMRTWWPQKCWQPPQWPLKWAPNLSAFVDTHGGTPFRRAIDRTMSHAYDERVLCCRRL
jgi:hypothetical protein